MLIKKQNLSSDNTNSKNFLFWLGAHHLCLIKSNLSPVILRSISVGSFTFYFTLYKYFNCCFYTYRRCPSAAPGSDKAEVRRLKGAFQCSELEDLAYIHPESVMFGNTESDFVVYQSMVESSRLFMRGGCD